MVKPGLNLDGLDAILAGQAGRNGWSLCVGAGVSRPMFADWPSLVAELADRVERDGSEQARTLLQQYSPDALIESVKNRLGVSEAEFSALLAEQLYAPLKAKLSAKDYAAFAGVLAAPRWPEISKPMWKDFLRVLDREFRYTTLYGLAEVVAAVVESELAPKCILSFNAEPTFLFALHGKLVQRNADLRDPTPVEGELRQYFDRVTHGISPRSPTRIPFYFCHGLLPIPGVAVRGDQRASVDKLVFSEGSYLAMANNAFSWQSSVFLDACVGSCIVFVGVSLSDPNMRRWLSWVHANKISELRERGFATKESTSHLWIRTPPDDEQLRPWLEATVAHLGVRIVWIPKWSAAGECLWRLLGRDARAA